jgi:glycosyltransferase involved in cell wall biosynthesis
VNRSVSVIIIARDEPLIRYALKSLEYQEVKPYEIIVVVDSPDDKSAEIASEFTDKLPDKGRSQ